MTTLHASAVVVDGLGVMILGPSGAGKSTLALGLLAHPGARQARLVADDRVIPIVAGGRLLADAPLATRGLIEVRGVGIARVPWLAPARIHLAVRLGEGRRMPEENRPVTIETVAIPCVELATAGANLADRVLIALGQLRTS